MESFSVPPIIDSVYKGIPIKDGDVVTIPCHVTGEPAPTVSWFFKGTRLTSSAKISVSSDHSIKYVVYILLSFLNFFSKIHISVYVADSIKAFYQ